MIQQLSSFLRSEEGATIIEYAFLALLIAIGLIAALTALQGVLETSFSNVTSNLN